MYCSEPLEDAKELFQDETLNNTPSSDIIRNYSKVGCVTVGNEFYFYKIYNFAGAYYFL